MADIDMDPNVTGIPAYTTAVIAPDEDNSAWDFQGTKFTGVFDGHDFTKLYEAFEKAKTVKRQPTVLIARTIKGKGVSFMENVAVFHGKAPNKDELDIAMKELE